MQIIFNFVPHDVYDYMDGLVEAMQIAEETGVTVLQERAMRRAMHPRLHYRWSRMRVIRRRLALCRRFFAGARRHRQRAFEVTRR